MCLAESYLNLPEMTAQRFFSWAATPDEPPIRLYRTGDLARWRSDGNLELIGRRDFQVKIRGFRVELNDVEAAIMHHKYVKKCAVTVIEPDTPHRRLAAYIVTGEEALSIAELRDFLRQRLPGYMVPADFMLLPVLPLTPTGKIDRKQLPAPPSMRPELTVSYVAPQTHIEQTLAEIWAEMLGREKIGVHDNFFDLGGHSLLATQVVSRIRNRLKVEFAQRSFFESPTIAEQARLIAQQQVNSGASQIDKQMADLLSELEALSDAEAEALLAQVIETDPDNDNQH
jgi:acyl carrier protein